MQEECKVLSIKNGLAQIAATRGDCEGCRACQIGSSGKQSVPALMRAECKAGDDVLVEMPEIRQAISPFALYLLPILFLAGGILMARMLTANELLQVFFAIVMCGFSFAVTYLIEKLFRNSQKYMPVIIKKIDKEAHDNDRL